MKLFNGTRQEILEKYGTSVNIDRASTLDILKSTYEQFNIPEERYDIAKEELEEGLNVIKSANKINNYIHNDIIFTNNEIEIPDIELIDVICPIIY